MFKKSILALLFIFLLLESYSFQLKADECKDFEKAVIALDAESDGHEKKMIQVYFLTTNGKKIKKF